MTSLQTIVNFCDERTGRGDVPDYPGAFNGLQIENNGKITKIGASVDASEEVFRRAASENIDFLIVHHGPFWGPVAPITGQRYRKFFNAMQSNLAVYGSHLPLDRHSEIGNNVLLAKHLDLGMKPAGQFANFEGVPMGWYFDLKIDRAALKNRLFEKFPRTVAMEHGAHELKRVAILTGSGGDVLPKLPSIGADTLITGECSQHHYTMCQEMELNLYTCGHYDTEVFAVQALAQEVSEKFALPWEFIPTNCPL